jgi:hypothetical protein
MRRRGEAGAIVTPERHRRKGRSAMDGVATSEGVTVGRVSQWPQAQAPPQAQPPDAAPDEGPEDVANRENRRRTRSLPQSGHASAVSTVDAIGRVCSNGRSHARHTYS